MVRLVSSVRFRQGALVLSSKSVLVTALMLEMPGRVKYPLATVIRPLRPLFSDASRTNRARRQNVYGGADQPD